jgi:hypothetical protein
VQQVVVNINHVQAEDTPGVLQEVANRGLSAIAPSPWRR